jgi:hypothetical protein
MPTFLAITNFWKGSECELLLGMFKRLARQSPPHCRAATFCQPTRNKKGPTANLQEESWQRERLQPGAAIEGFITNDEAKFGRVTLFKLEQRQTISRAIFVSESGITTSSSAVQP